MGLTQINQLFGITAEDRAIAEQFLNDPELGEAIAAWAVYRILGLPGVTPAMNDRLEYLLNQARARYLAERDEHETHLGAG